ncbi:uncharacterized protein LOC124126349 isoform X2 [Haliotis rufescens]|uniref:uncharacterized protein LOC124126349 isoform X2 n=1 Tax=Haliotis rufescens TaxID=6454 RepID=UPI00201F9402|nr:uncharacterized protein LOC124126349 isoform X2 [Haliotis rufescens]
MSWLGYVPKGKLEEVEELARKESRRTNEALKLVKEQGERAKTLEAEMQHLQFEKEEKEKRDKKLMQFSWGPKNKAAGQWTTQFQASRYGDHWIIDMPGIFESGDFKTENIEAIASGKVRFDAQITKTLEVEDGQSQQEARRDVSCVVLVLHHNIDLGEELKRQLNVIMQLGGKGVLSYHLVLTHLDECDPQFKDPDNLPNLYNSPLVQEAVKNMSEQTGIQPCSISYVKNYVTETETDTKTKLLHLKALDRILNSAADQVEKIIDSKLQSSMYDDAPDA